MTATDIAGCTGSSRAVGAAHLRGKSGRRSEDGLQIGAAWNRGCRLSVVDARPERCFGKLRALSGVRRIIRVDLGRLGAAVQKTRSSSPWNVERLKWRSSSEATRSAMGTPRLDRFDFGVPSLPRVMLRRTRTRPAVQSTSRQRKAMSSPWRSPVRAAVRYSGISIAPSSSFGIDLNSASSSTTSRKRMSGSVPSWRGRFTAATGLLATQP
jgi:hypothetical protein